MFKCTATLIVISFVLFYTIEPGTAKPVPLYFGDSIPVYMKGHFMDDYGIRYHITDSVWTQQPGIKYHILKWNTKEHYLVARNDMNNPSEPGLYSRIDYMPFADMKPYSWGFCLTVYNAANDSIAENSIKPNRENPKKGCGGYPFSRMKKM